jgi:hypothetical protein
MLRVLALVANTVLMAAAAIVHEPIVFGSGLFMLVTQQMSLASLR